MGGGGGGGGQLLLQPAALSLQLDASKKIIFDHVVVE